ncbi:MAG: helix-turn-helix domain-containing protein [Vicinamibacterales bacterium]
MPIDLRTHVAAYVTVGELAEYWAVSRRQIYRQIQSGDLLALKFGPRLWRVSADSARQLERTSELGPTRRSRPHLKIVLGHRTKFSGSNNPEGR